MDSYCQSGTNAPLFPVPLMIVPPFAALTKEPPASTELLIVPLMVFVPSSFSHWPLPQPAVTISVPFEPLGVLGAIEYGVKAPP